MKRFPVISICFILLLIFNGFVQLAIILAGSHGSFIFSDVNFRLGAVIATILFGGGFFHTIYIFKGTSVGRMANFLSICVYVVVLVALVYVILFNKPSVYDEWSTALYGSNFVSAAMTLFFLFLSVARVKP